MVIRLVFMLNFPKNQHFLPLICTSTWGNQRVINISFSGNFAYELNEWSLTTLCLKIVAEQFKSSHQSVLWKKVFLKVSQNHQEKHLCQSLFSNWFDWNSKFCFQKNYEENNKLKQNNKNVYSLHCHSCLKIFLMTFMYAKE